jgi:hypothetical protein
MIVGRANVLTALGLLVLLLAVVLTAPRWTRLLTRTPPGEDGAEEAGPAAAAEPEAPAAVEQKITVKLFFLAPDQPALLIEDREVAYSADLARQLRTVSQLVRLEPNPTLVGAFLRRALELMLELEQLARWQDLITEIKGYTALAEELRERRPDVSETIGKALSDFENVQEWIARSRLEIDQARLLVLRAAWRLDHEGNQAVRADVAAIKVVAAQMQTRILDRAIQVFGAMGLSPDTPLAQLWSWGRAMRILDGPDEVHLRTVARAELTRAKANRGASAPYLQRWMPPHPDDLELPTIL